MALLSTRGRIGEAPDKSGHPQDRATLKSVGLNSEVDENLRQILITGLADSSVLRGVDA